MIPVLMEQLNYALTFSGLTGRTTAAAAAAAAALMLLCAVYVQHQTLSGHAGLLEGIKRRRKKNFQRLLRGCQHCVTGGVQSKKHFLFLLMLLWKKKTKHQPHKMEGRWRGWWWWWRGGGDSTLVVLSLNEVLKLNWLRKWLMCIMELRVALHKGVC